MSLIYRKLQDSGMIYSLFRYDVASEMEHPSFTEGPQCKRGKTYSLMLRPFNDKLTLKLPGVSLAFFIFSAALLFAQTANAQWVSDTITNTPVCVSTNLRGNPQICSDGSDGAIIAWEDFRGGSYRIYAQRLDQNGRPVWPTNGVMLALTNQDQRYPIVASDNNGGAYVVWQDERNQSTDGIDLYAQHITAAGLLTYDSDGRAVVAISGNQDNAAIVADGFGNAFVVWEDGRSGGSTVPDIYMNRLTPSGIAWGSQGQPLTVQSSEQRMPVLCEDGSHGFYCAWMNDATVPTSVYGQHVDSTGTVLWTTPYGINIYEGETGSENCKDISIRRDGNEVMLAWEMTDYNTQDGQDIYANRLASNGTKIYYSSVAVTGEYPGDQTYPKVFSDDSTGTGQFPYSGLMVLFENNAGGEPQQVSMIRTLDDGSTCVPSSGSYPVSYPLDGMNGFAAVKTASGSVIAVWNDSRFDTSIYAQRVDRDLRSYFPHPEPSNWGLAVCARAAKASQVVLAPRTNGAIAAWTDFRNGTAEIYAQLIFNDGTLPIQLSSFDLSAPRVGEVDVAWQTASEQSCAGFELQRRLIADGADNNYSVVASYETNPELRGAGTSSVAHYYAYRDRTVQPATYEYRLIDISLDGSRNASAPKIIDASSATDGGAWSLGFNAPNPFTTLTEIPVTLPTSAIVDVTVIDIAGRTIANPVANQLLTGGTHFISLDAAALGNVSGTYFARMTATDPDSGMILWQSESPLVIALIR
jgi:hypothetical protein